MANLPNDQSFYRVIISRELHVHASSADEAINMARNAAQYTVQKFTAELMNPPPNEAVPL